MVSLVDIVPQTRTVRIAGGELELRGLGLRQIASLLLQFPSLRNVITDGTAIDFTELLALAPDAIATIIAEAAGQPEAVDAIVEGRLTPDEVLDCLTAIHDITFPGGVRPLLERLGLFNAAADAEPVPAGKGRGTNTPLPQNNSSPPDMIAAE